MALPNVGSPISLNQVNVELSLSGTTTISLNQTSVRNLFQVASGTISMYDGYGKSAGVAPSVSSYSSTPTRVCWNTPFDQDVSWYVNGGTGTISVKIQHAPINTCNWSYYNSGEVVSTLTAPGWISINTETYRPAGTSTNSAFRLELSNSIGTTTTPAVGIIYDNCNQFDYCSASDNCIDTNTWGCYNCSEVTTCIPCTYDCNCDGVTGYGTGGCSCPPQQESCGYCMEQYTCNCTGCCDENNENCTCGCEGTFTNGVPDCPNPSYPCVGGYMTCEIVISCPCGNTCGPTGTTLSRRTCQQHDTSGAAAYFNNTYNSCDG